MRTAALESGVPLGGRAARRVRDRDNPEQADRGADQAARTRPTRCRAGGWPPPQGIDFQVTREIAPYA